jgi:cbb3-type cytochrome oxidase maturation protein
MEVLMLLIPLSVALVVLIGAAFWWSVHAGQFDDLDGPAHRILADDDAGDAPDRGALTSVNVEKRSRR